MAQTVLIADDSIASQRLFEMVLTREGYHVITVGSGSEILGRIKEKQPDLALIDALMPGVDGYQICQTLKKDPKLQNLPIVMLAGTYEDVDREKGAKILGAKAILDKPAKSTVIISKIKEMLALQEQLQRAKEKPKSTPAQAQAVAKETPKTESFAEVVQEPPFVEKEYEFEEDSAEVDLVVETEILDEEAEWEEVEEEQEAFPTAAYEEETESELFTAPVLEEEPSIAEPMLAEEPIAAAPIPAEEPSSAEPMPTEEPIIEELLPEEEPIIAASTFTVAEIVAQKPVLAAKETPEQFLVSEENLDALAERIAARVAGKLVPALIQSVAKYVLEIPAIRQIVDHASKNLIKEILPELRDQMKIDH